MSSNNIDDLMTVALQFQQRMQQIAPQNANHCIVGQSSDGLVKILMAPTTGSQMIAKRVLLDASAQTQSKTCLEQLIVEAINDASNKLNERIRTQVRQLDDDIKLPAGLQLF